MTNGKKYMIKNSKNLYSRGGYFPVFFGNMANGKIWNGIGAIKNHLNLIMSSNNNQIPEDWVIVEVNLIEGQHTNAKELHQESYIQKRRKNEIDWKERQRIYLLEEKDRIEKQLKNL